MINQFRDENRFLSNFSESEIEFRGHIFPTVEHAFVFAKTDVPEEQEIVLEGRSLSPAKIKKLGKELTLRPNWGTERIKVMTELLRLKFTIPELREKLMATGQQKLVEGNNWGDVFWGVDLETGKGENWLGNCLMGVREEIRYGVL